MAGLGAGLPHAVAAAALLDVTYHRHKPKPRIVASPSTIADRTVTAVELVLGCSVLAWSAGLVRGTSSSSSLDPMEREKERSLVKNMFFRYQILTKVSETALRVVSQLNNIIVKFIHFGTVVL